VPFYFLFNSSIQSLYGHPEYLGFFFLTTAAFLFLGEKCAIQRIKAATSPRKAFDALIIGCAQAFAIVPGVSRSGSTMSTALMLGWKRDRAAKFSFLLSIPTICGGVFLETIKVIKSNAHPPGISWVTYATGFVTSFIIGSLVLRWFLNLQKKSTFKTFAWYCLFLGVGTLLFVNFFHF
jgi:undecaprenyl-diphosphatase